MKIQRHTALLIDATRAARLFLDCVPDVAYWDADEHRRTRIRTNYFVKNVLRFFSPFCHSERSEESHVRSRARPFAAAQGDGSSARAACQNVCYGVLMLWSTTVCTPLPAGLKPSAGDTKPTAVGWNGAASI